jgi:copper(I)-binding protein
MATSPILAPVALMLVTFVPSPVAAQAPVPAAASVTVRDAWVRTPAPSVPMTAGYMTLENPSSQDVTLVAATSIAAGTIELHEMRDENGRASMRMVDRIVIPARGTVTLAPGGLHLMIIGMPKPLVAGDDVPITLRMSNGTVAIARAVVKAAK